MNKLLLFYCITVLLLLSSRAVAQNGALDKVWLQGEYDVYTSVFTGSSPINQKFVTPNPYDFALGSSNICDSSGNLILACNGYTLYDKNLSPIDGGEIIVPTELYQDQGGFNNYAQSSIILPLGNSKYGVITPVASDSEIINYWHQPQKGRALFDQLLYDEVDMNANAGAGKVTQKMVPLLRDVILSKTQMMACRHGDGKSWWLLKQANDTNMIYKFLFSGGKIYGPYIQGFPEPHFSKWDVCGQAMFSPDGTRYATTIQGSNKLFLADFDRCSGMLSNPKTYNVPSKNVHNPFDSTEIDSSSCGLCFSPNGRFVYVNGFYNVQQLDLMDSNPATEWTVLSGLDTNWLEFQSYSNIYPGPDGKLYVGNWSGLGGQMSVINSPDLKGTAANFCAKCMRFPGHLQQGIYRFIGVSGPPCMPNYHLGAMNPICYPTSVQTIMTEQRFLLYPNPSHGTIEVKYEASGELRLYDVTGREVSISPLPTPGNRVVSIDISHLPAGVYMYQYWTNHLVVKSGRIIITF